MATKSILKTVHIKNPQSAERLISALEDAAAKPEKEAEVSVAASDASREEIRRMFGAAK